MHTVTMCVAAAWRSSMSDVRSTRPTWACTRSIFNHLTVISHCLCFVILILASSKPETLFAYNQTRPECREIDLVSLWRRKTTLSHIQCRSPWEKDQILRWSQLKLESNQSQVKSESTEIRMNIRLGDSQVRRNLDWMRIRLGDIWGKVRLGESLV